MNNRLLVAAIANHSTTTGLLPTIFSKWTWIFVFFLVIIVISDILIFFSQTKLCRFELSLKFSSQYFSRLMNIFFSIVCSNFQFAPFFLAGKQLVFQFLGHCRFHRRVEGEVASWQRLPSWQALPPCQLCPLIF